MQELLKIIFPDAKKGKNIRTRILEAAAIAFYHRQTEIPVVNILLSDDAPQFKKLTAGHALCWIHEGRHYNRLSPIVPFNVDELKKFKTNFWDYYGDLLKYKENLNPATAAKLSSEFDNLFSTKTGYNDLDDRIEKTRSKKKSFCWFSNIPAYHCTIMIRNWVQGSKNAGKMSVCKQNQMKGQRLKTHF